MGIGDMYRSVARGIRKVLHDTPVEVLVGALAVGSAGFVVGHKLESNREKTVPLAFSEIGQLEDAARTEGKELDLFTRYHAGLNDLVMKVMESWNSAWKYSTSPEGAYKKFAEELEKGMTTRQYRHNIADFMESVPLDAGEALHTLSPLTTAKPIVSEAEQQLGRSWNDSHHDNYHTELRTRTVSHRDSKGNVSYSTEFYTVQVYDDTTHTYQYNKDSGEAASRTLDILLSDFADFSLAINMRTASRVQRENYEAMQASRKMDDGETLAEDELLKLANTWNQGSNVQQYAGFLARPFGELGDDANVWRVHKNTAHGDQYKTRSHSDSGPMEFQTAARARTHAQQYLASVDAVTKGLLFTQQNMPELHKKITGFIEYMLRPHPNAQLDPEQAALEIRNQTIDLYGQNFGRGFDMEQYRAGMVVLYGVLGILAGAALGFGFDQGARKLGLWDEVTRDYKKDFSRPEQD